MASSSRATSSLYGRPMKFTPSRRLYGLGSILLVTVTVCSRKLSSVGEPSFIISLGVAGIAYLLAIREFFSTPRFPRGLIVIGLVLAALWHVPFLLTPAGTDDDAHLYVLGGRVQRVGYNPFILVSNNPVFAQLYTPPTPTLNNPGVPLPYPTPA